MKTKMILLLTVALSFLSACDKDDEPTYVPAPAVANNYTFLEDTIDITDAEIEFVAGDTYVRFRGETIDDYVIFTFANRTGIVPVGTFTYHGDRNNGYIVEDHFLRGAISHISDQLDYYATEGTVTITKEGDGVHKVSFHVETISGGAKGEYLGEIRPAD